MDKVEKLYKNFGVLADAKDKISEHEKEFLEILNAVKGSSNEKRLASQFIARFFKHFPHLIDQAIDAQLDLCEDDDVSIRKQAIKDLPGLCKENPEHLLKIADVLAQLLQTEDPTELSAVHNSIMTLFKVDVKGTLRGLFSQILSGDDIVRERAIKFLSTKLRTLGEDVMTKDAEECLLVECKKALQDVTAAEFVTFMQLLSGLKIVKTISGQQQMVDIVAEQAELGKEFDYTDPDIVDRLIQCIKHVLPFFNCLVHTTKFLVYMCQQVLPVLSEIKSPVEGVNVQLELLKLVAELCTHLGSMDEYKAVITIVFNKLLEYMPLPPVVEENAENFSNDDPKLEFSYVECLMYAFHQLGRRHPTFLTEENNVELLKDLKIRLQFFARGIQGYIKKLRESLQDKNAEELKTDENKLKLAALRTTSNINILIRDLFHTPPSYKSNVTLSWKPVSTSVSFTSREMQLQRTSKELTGMKRPAHTPITFDEGGNKSKKVAAGSANKGARQIYTPPGGKYSTKVSNFNQAMKSVRGRGGGGRGGRRQGRGNWIY